MTQSHRRTNVINLQWFQSVYTTKGGGVMGGGNHSTKTLARESNGTWGRPSRPKRRSESFQTVVSSLQVPGGQMSGSRPWGYRLPLGLFGCLNWQFLARQKPLLRMYLHVGTDLPHLPPPPEKHQIQGMIKLVHFWTKTRFSGYLTLKWRHSLVENCHYVKYLAIKCLLLF